MRGWRYVGIMVMYLLKLDFKYGLVVLAVSEFPRWQQVALHLKTAQKSKSCTLGASQTAAWMTDLTIWSLDQILYKYKI